MMNGNVFISMNRFGYALLEELLLRRVPISQIYTVDPKNATNISDYEDFHPLAKKNNIPIQSVKHIADVKKDVRRLKPPYIFVFGWSQLLDVEFLNLAQIGVIGSHPALLPKNRGRAAIPWHFIRGEKEGGITFFYMDEGCDSGDIIAQERFRIGPNDTATDYYRAITQRGIRVISRLAGQLVRGKRLPARKQNHTRATYLSKRTFADGLIDWNQSAVQIDRLVRALTDPYPGAWATYKDATVYVDRTHVVKKETYSGTIGQVVGQTKDGMVVQTGKGLLAITSMRGAEGSPSSHIPVGHKLGFSIVDLWLKKS